MSATSRSQKRRLASPLLRDGSFSSRCICATTILVFLVRHFSTQSLMNTRDETSLFLVLTENGRGREEMNAKSTGTSRNDAASYKKTTSYEVTNKKNKENQATDIKSKPERTLPPTEKNATISQHDKQFGKIKNHNVNSSTTPPENNAYPPLFLKMKGEGWKIWHDSDTPLYPSKESTLLLKESKNWICHWTTFRPSLNVKRRTFFQEKYHNNNKSNDNNGNNTSNKSFSVNIVDEKKHASICTHDPNNEDIWVSRALRSHGRWRDCDSLTFWYDESQPKLKHMYSKERQVQTEATTGWYIDVGANIGSCVLQVLLTTNASIAAFEPDPRNLFHLTSTLVHLEPRLRKRVYVFPVALGDATGSSEIHVAADNRGNAVVGQSIQDHANPNQTFLDPIAIPVERIDDLIMPVKSGLSGNAHLAHNRVLLMKMDAQGYECKIVQGMSQLLATIPTVVFELEKGMLRSFPNCNEKILWDSFVGDEVPGENFNMYNDFLAAAGLPKGLASVKDMPKTNEGVNLVAHRTHQTMS